MIAIRAWNLSPDPQTIAALRAEWGLDRPLVERYLRWLAGFAAGDWGRSLRTGEPVLAEFTARLPLSLALGLSGLVLSALLAVPIGFAAALTPGGIADRLSRLLAVAVQAMPTFWIGLIAIWLLGVQFQLMHPFSGGPGAIVLAVCLIALHSTGLLARVYRRDLLAQAQEPYFRTALAKGLSRRQALWRHGNRSALYAMLAALRSEGGWAIGTSATLEVLFGLPGVSQFLVASMAARDHFVLLAYVMCVAIWMAAMNAGLSFVLHRLDPRPT